MRRAILFVIAEGLLVFLLPTCDQGGRSQPPWGLEGVDQPSDEATVTRILEAMPDALSGRNRSASSDPFRVAYGEEGTATLRAMRLGEQAAAEGFPGTAGEFLQQLAASGEIEIEARRLDPASDLVYLVGKTTVSTEIPGRGLINERTEYLMGWGEPDSGWMFTTAADSPGIRRALVEAFIEAVQSTA